MTTQKMLDQLAEAASRGDVLVIPAAQAGRLLRLQGRSRLPAVEGEVRPALAIGELDLVNAGRHLPGVFGEVLS